MVHCIYRGVTDYNFQNKKYCLSVKIDFVLSNSADLDEMAHCAAFHLGHHRLPKYLFFEGLKNASLDIKCESFASHRTFYQ